MERAQLETALTSAAPRVWELIGPAVDRILPQMRALIDHALLRLCNGVAAYLVDGDLTDELRTELGDIGLGLSRMMAWDLIDELNKAYIQIAVDVMVDSEAVDAGNAARVAISVSDALYDGFWVFNNHEGLEQALRLGALIDHFPTPTFMLDGFGSVTFANDATRLEPIWES